MKAASPILPVHFLGETSSPRHGRDVVLGGMVEHAVWHLARTMPWILSNRRWPTAQLKGGSGRGGSAAGGRRGEGPVRSELLELVGELRACDPRVLEMAGIEVKHVRYAQTLCDFLEKLDLPSA